MRTLTPRLLLLLGALLAVSIFGSWTEDRSDAAVSAEAQSIAPRPHPESLGMSGVGISAMSLDALGGRSAFYSTSGSSYFSTGSPFAR